MHILTARLIALLGCLAQLSLGCSPAPAAVPDSPSTPQGVSEAADKLASEEYELLYADATLQELEGEIEVYEAALSDGTQPYYDACFEQGRYQIVGAYEPGTKYPVSPEQGRLFSVRFLASKQVARVDLPREEFPEMYELQERLVWLAQRCNQLPPGDARKY